MSAFSKLFPVHSALEDSLVGRNCPHPAAPISVPSAQISGSDSIPGTLAKYIIINQCGLELAIIIPEAITHSQAVNLADVKPVSAGFYYLDAARHVQTHGHSTSLQLQPRPQDAEIIHNTLLLLGLL